MSVVHLYASTSGEDAHPAKMNIELGGKLVAELQVRRRRAKLVSEALSADRLRDRWRDVSRSSALIYAADLLEHKGISFFDNLYATSPIQFPISIVRWLKLSKRVSRNINKHWVFQKGKKPRFVQFPTEMKLAKLPPPKLRLCEAGGLWNNFRRWKRNGRPLRMTFNGTRWKQRAMSEDKAAKGCASLRTLQRKI